MSRPRKLPDLLRGFGVPRDDRRKAKAFSASYQWLLPVKPLPPVKPPVKPPISKGDTR